MIEPSRIRILNSAPPREDGRYVLYWMQSAQRAAFNPALELAISEANERGLPVLVCFGLTDGFPEANARHYHFMLQGLAQVEKALASRGVGFCLRKGSPEHLTLQLAEDAALVVCDRGYLRIQRQWRQTLADHIGRRLVQVEGEVIVPVETASPKHEYAARTLRPKLKRLFEPYLAPLAEQAVRIKAQGLPAGELDLSDVDGLVASLAIDHEVRPVRRFEGGEIASRRRLAAFLSDGLSRYASQRNRPEAHAASHMSPYLHFGQISPVEIALAAREARADEADKGSYLEELLVRRELAINHVFYAEDYDRYEGLPDWARQALAKTAGQARPHLYTEAQLVAGATHDRYWNAAQMEMRETGYMHNQMRMYWGKKVLEWSPSPQDAWRTLLRLNNRFFLDGRDPNSFANVGWIFGLHDRPWGPQPVFGTVRSMGPNTFKKFDAEAYVAQVEALAAAERQSPMDSSSRA
jgi:deoxyribodipyrimidine photo-lyase